MSDVYQILKDENYPFTAKIDSSVKKELTIKADTFYCDTKVCGFSLSFLTVVCEKVMTPAEAPEASEEAE